MRRRTRSRLLGVAVGVAAIVVATLFVLIALGYLALPSTPSPKVSLTGVRWTIVQGTTSSGIGWFGPSQFNYSTADGYPIEIALGGTVSIPWSFSNYDSVNRTIYSVVVAAPFTFVSCHPGLPVSVPSGTDDGFVGITVRAPNGAGQSVELNLTLDAR